jgi:hypothetical protein
MEGKCSRAGDEYVLVDCKRIDRLFSLIQRCHDEQAFANLMLMPGRGCL